jgi:hypothetical protein
LRFLCLWGAFAPRGLLWADFLSPIWPHSEAKDLNGGKLNKSNQGHGGVPNPFPALIRDEEGLKPGDQVKAAVNYLRLAFGNRLTVFCTMQGASER